ncbi:MAG: peptide-binding protein [Candidatus Omnitrophica bacterium]|nr:peptide-binding protein [Candidatus Omnitrophota bacterium]
MNLKNSFLLLVLFFVPAFLSAGGDHQNGDAFVAASIGEPVNLLPLFAADSASAEVSKLIFNGLVKYDKDLKLTGDLAESWEVKDGGLRIVFYLRKNVKWQDGEPFTAADVEFTYQKLTDPRIPTPYGGDFEKVVSLAVKDPYTVEVVYKEPFSPGLASWGMGILPRHLLLHENLPATRFSRAPIGTGPYLLKQWKSQDQLLLQANPRYFEGRPLIDRYVYRIIPDQATTFLELQTENVDFVNLSPLQFKRQTDTPFFRRKYQKLKIPSFGYAYIGYNLLSPLFADKKARQAVGMAINKKDIIDVTLLGFGRPATGPFLPESWAYHPGVRESAFHPERAKALLEEAGWSDTDGDGWLDKDGRKFSFTILTNQGNDQRKMACEMVQKRLKDVGIEMKIQIVEWGVFLKEFIDKRRFDAVLLGWQLSPDPDVYELFHSSRAVPGKFNFVSYKNPEVDRLLEEGRRLFGEEARATVYRRVHEILSEEEPYTFLYVPETLVAVHRRFRGVEVGPAGIGHNFIRWFVPEGERRYKSPDRRFWA